MITILSSITIWLAICIYTDWKICYANTVWRKKNTEDYKKYKSIYTDNFEERYIKGFLFIFFPIVLFISILINGIKILKNDRSIFNGEVL